MYLDCPTAYFAHSTIRIEANVVNAESAVRVHAVLGALACSAGGLERGDQGELGEPVTEVLQMVFIDEEEDCFKGCENAFLECCR